MLQCIFFLAFSFRKHFDHLLLIDQMKIGIRHFCPVKTNDPEYHYLTDDLEKSISTRR